MFKELYQAGTIGDVEIKNSLSHAINTFLEPIREKRASFEKGYVEKVIYEGTLRMREVAAATLKEVRASMGLTGSWKKIARIATKA